MTTATWALQTAIYARLIADPDLTSVLGGQKVFDHVPRGTQPPYVTFGITTERDWSTGTETGSEHEISLLVWSQNRGRRELQAVTDTLRDALHDAALSLTGHRLINLRHAFSELRREPDGETWRGLIRLRAVTEPLT